MLTVPSVITALLIVKLNSSPLLSMSGYGASPLVPFRTMHPSNSVLSVVLSYDSKSLINEVSDEDNCCHKSIIVSSPVIRTRHILGA